MPPRLEVEDAPCGQTGRHFNPYNVDASSSPYGGFEFAVSNLFQVVKSKTAAGFVPNFAAWG